MSSANASASVTSGIKRIIPCLDVAAGRVVKGVNFVGLRDAGDPVEIAQRYCEQGADELAFLDITATTDERALVLPMVQAVVQNITVPLTMGGGVRSMEDIARLFDVGVSKASINSAAVSNPGLIDAAAAAFGSQRIMVAIDAKRRSSEDEQRLDAQGQPVGPGWDVYTHGGNHNTGLDAVRWAKELVQRGAGEVLLTSMERDGMKNGFDLGLTRAVSDAVAPVPVIASGGVGDLQHLVDGVLQGGADAVLAASIFHFGTFTVGQAKAFMREHGIAVAL